MVHQKDSVIEHLVEDTVDDLFVSLCETYDLPFGDISPGQSMQLSSINRDLRELAVAFVNQNMKKNEED